MYAAGPSGDPCTSTVTRGVLLCYINIGQQRHMLAHSVSITSQIGRMRCINYYA